jgi:hypothetical protein
MKLIPLTQGRFAKVDDEDYEELSKYKWHAAVKPRTIYAGRYARINGKERQIFMHRQLLGIMDSKALGDHKDNDGLNNTRDNLRISDPSKNNRNRRSWLRATSRFVGVCWHKKDKKWQAAIQANGRQKHLGQFNSEEDAARARDAAAREFYGHEAYLNFKP